MKIKYLLICATFLLLCNSNFAQQYEEFVCPANSSSSYLQQDPKAGRSNKCCSKGTQVKLEYSGDTQIVKSAEAVRLDNTPGPHRVRLDVEWNAQGEGVVLFDIYYRRMRSGGTFCNCDFEAWTLLYTYKITRKSISPGGSLSGTAVRTTKDEQSLINFPLTYQKASNYDYDVNKIRWYINGQLDGDATGTNTISISPKAKQIGDYTITTEVYNLCNEWKSGPSSTISIKPTCYQDNPNSSSLSLTGPGLTVHSEGYEVEKDNSYTIGVSGVTDFDYHYDLSHDGGEDISLTSKQLVMNAELGSYRVEASRKGGREECPVINPMSVFVGGHDLTIEDNCLITLPEDLSDFLDKPIVPGEPALEHFAATVTSKKGFIIKPGIVLSKGAELILDYNEPVIDDSELDPNKNFIQTTSYDEYGRILRQSRQYFDDRGRATQSQYKNLTKDVLLASEVLYDGQGRTVINTLTAPVKSGTFEETVDECGDNVQIGAKVRFEFKEKFVTDANNTKYDYKKFDGAKEVSPEPVGSTEEGTLGWYYSDNNGESADEKLNEPLVATTSYPYTRTVFHHDGTEDIKSISKPGDVFRIGGGHTGETDKEEVDNGDSYLDDYLAIRENELGLKRPTVYEGNFFKTVNTDGQGYTSITYQDIAGNGIISLYLANQTTPVTRSYQFYNNLNQLIVSLSPNGWQQYNSGVNFDEVDKTSYSYDVKGQLIATQETDAGRTEFVYRKDGSIRFSQNSEQRKEEKYSYTHYDKTGRPVESGEYTPVFDGIRFNSQQMRAILEDVSVDGGLSKDLGIRTDVIYTYYDLPDPDLPVDRKQRFVHGAVSYSKNENTTIWYSYDEQGSIEWLVQDIVGLGIKIADYRYGPTGDVREVAYQRGNAGTDFYHYYDYDTDGRLSRIYTATEPLVYDHFGELTNPEVLKQQALYDYYLHGPLKRVELADQLQGIDYIYTADGALKGINSGNPDQDPGEDGITNDFQADVFGMTLDYYNNDYRSAALGTVSLSGSGVAQQFTGNIRAQSWFSPVDNGQMRGYVYTYDKRNQLQEARWGNAMPTTSGFGFVADPTEAFKVAISEYDLNGNIRQLNRKAEQGAGIAQFVYHYKEHTNQLTDVTDASQPFRGYEYNDIGQMTRQQNTDGELYQQYDVSGKLMGSYKSYDEATGIYTDPVVTFTYDDRGFRVSKISYEDGLQKQRTWYVRDPSGSLLSLYEQDLETDDPAKQTEIPIYGSGRIGLYKPQATIHQHLYELSDHLGNVRAVIGEDISVEYLATMETERENNEDMAIDGNFENIQRISTADRINHTPSVVIEDGIEYTINDPNEVVRLNGYHNITEGPGILLEVSPGDKIEVEVYVKYLDLRRDEGIGATALLAYLMGGIHNPAYTQTSVEGGGALITDRLNNVSALIGATSDIDVPEAFLNYHFLDHNQNPVHGQLDFIQISDAAAIDPLNIDKTHEKLYLEIEVTQPGFAYINVTHDAQENVDVYFDDLKVTHTYGNIVAGSDYYPFGLAMEGREITREDFRYGYQGQFSEEDEETGWNSFELRMYDPVIGRWLTTDPYRQFVSPYVGMGNNPANGVDYDGGFWDQGINSKGEIVYDNGINNGNVYLVNDGYSEPIQSLSQLKENSTQIVANNIWIGTESQLKNYVLSQFAFVDFAWPYAVRIKESLNQGFTMDTKKLIKTSGSEVMLKPKAIEDFAFEIRYSTSQGNVILGNVYNVRNSLEHEKRHFITTLTMINSGIEQVGFSSYERAREWSEQGAITYQRNRPSWIRTNAAFKAYTRDYWNRVTIKR
ncbi:hypothetical protein C900_04246 [Fulvivirga imtechensis AK7]|uniref:RHS repeat-associated core domain-containing protein n=1 Tax=Fulvivirga imtechensis AK7 TaxID=1237149 RepID=L8K0D2_9BACT|nr:RHS repeat-associated core domain-containing protein [Fulvivirga imtechensis]ELR73394.1 hypothetical protein C900_04246 [Fulvivirga imtechensis AK7]